MALSLLVRLAALSLFFVGAAAADSPVAKVIKLLSDLKKEVENDGKTEATAYGKYACFCKDTTKTKSESITKGADKISTLSADITDNTATKEGKETEVKERKENQEQLGTDLQTTVARCSTAQAKYEAGTADMAKAIESLNKAIKAMDAQKKQMALAAKQSKKGKIGTAKAVVKKALLDIGGASSVDKDIQRALAYAGLDPNDPAYKYHSKEINDILSKLLKDFTDDKKEIGDKWTKTSLACTGERDGLNKKMKDNLDAITKAQEVIQDLKKRIATDRGDLVKAQDTLEEDEKYLKDVTAQCETKATDFDQRAQMRNDEIQALATAVKVISNKVEGADKDVNKRALLQRTKKSPAGLHLSLLQAVPVKPVTNFLSKAVVSSSEQAIHDQVVTLLRQEGSRLGSPELSAVAMQISADHFQKIKAIIQSLIERLLDEEHAEASKKGFCDMEIAKAQKDREHSKGNADSLGVQLKELESTKEELEAELKQLAKDILEANVELQKALDLRKTEKVDNAETLQTAQGGLEALKEAILILRAFYNDADKRLNVLLQAAPDAGFSGSYEGKQKSSRAIFTLLETISTDFQRTISKTEQSEAESAAAFVKFDRTSKENIGSKETKTTLDKQDLKSTNTNIEKTLDDLKTEMGLLDGAQKIIESLKPACLDAGGMSFKERTTKRNEEIAALNKAICILTPGKKEGECK